MEWKAEYIWCILGVIMLLAEFVSPGFVIMFFGLGALLVALVLMFVEIHINAQIILFLIFSLLSLLLLRKLIKSIFKGVTGQQDKLPSSADLFVGEKAVTEGEIIPGAIGKVEFHGTLWNAVSNEKIPSGTTVIVEKQDNLTLEVKPLK